ncbi:hypothetical protein NL676_033734 [Syzygium grande]|nr:hypothetical protein NL676_033734 [Syzygium grande]
MTFEFARIPFPSSRPNQNRANGVAGRRRNGERDQMFAILCLPQHTDVRYMSVNLCQLAKWLLGVHPSSIGHDSGAIKDR